MTGRNIINRLIFSFDVQDEAVFREFSAKMERMAEGGLADELDRILKAYSPKDFDITIDRLELDIGEISIHDLEKNFASKLSGSLQSYLAGMERKDAGTLHERTRSKSRRDRLLTYFIQHGNLPWWAARNERIDNMSLLSLLRRPSYKIKNLIFHALRDPERSRRLLHLLDLDALISLWVDMKAHHLGWTSKDMSLLAEGISHRLEGRYGRGGVQDRMKENILRHLLLITNAPEARFDPKRPGELLLPDFFQARPAMNTGKAPVPTRSAPSVPTAVTQNDLPVDRIGKPPVSARKTPSVPAAVTQNDLPEVAIPKPYQAALPEQKEDMLAQLRYFLETGHLPGQRSVSLSEAVNRLFMGLMADHLQDLEDLVIRLGKSRMVRDRIIDRVSSKSLRRFFEKAAPRKKELLEWVRDVYISAQRTLKPINQTNIRVQRSVDEITLEIYARNDLNNIDDQAFLQLHFQKMALRHNLRYADLLSVVADSMAISGISSENRFSQIVNQLLEATRESQQLRDGMPVTPSDMRRYAQQLPDELIRILPKDFMRELIYLKGTDILGKGNRALQDLISAYLRYGKNVPAAVVEDPGVLFEKIAAHIDIDRDFMVFALRYNLMHHQGNQQFTVHDHPMASALGVRSLKIDKADPSGMTELLAHLTRFRSHYEARQVRRILEEKLLTFELTDKVFEKLVQLLYEEEADAVSVAVRYLLAGSGITTDSRIVEDAKRSFIRGSLESRNMPVNMNRLFATLRRAVHPDADTPYILPEKLSEARPFFAPPPQTMQLRQGKAKARWTREKEIINLYNILDLDRVLQEAGVNFFDNILFSFELLLTKHSMEFKQILRDNRFNRELAHFFSYGDDSGLFRQLSRIYPESRMSAIVRQYETVLAMLRRLGWLKQEGDALRAFVMLDMYPALFSDQPVSQSLAGIMDTIIARAGEEQQLTPMFSSLFAANRLEEVTVMLMRRIGRTAFMKLFKEDPSSATAWKPVPQQLIAWKSYAVTGQGDDTINEPSAWVSALLEQTVFPEGHPYAGTPADEKTDHIRNILSVDDDAVFLLIRKEKRSSRLHLLADWLDRQGLYKALSVRFGTNPEVLQAQVRAWMAAAKGVSISEEVFLRRIFVRQTIPSDEPALVRFNKAVASTLVMHGYMSSLQVMEIALDDQTRPVSLSEGLSIHLLAAPGHSRRVDFMDISLSSAVSADMDPAALREVIAAWVGYLRSSKPGITRRRSWEMIAEILIRNRVSTIKDEASLHRILMLGLIPVKTIRSSDLKVLMHNLKRHDIPEDLVLKTLGGQRSSDGLTFADRWMSPSADALIPGDSGGIPDLLQFFMAPAFGTALPPHIFRRVILAWAGYLSSIRQGRDEQRNLIRIAEILLRNRMSTIKDEASLHRILIRELIQVKRISSRDLLIFSVMLDRHKIPRDLVGRELRGKRTSDGVLTEDVFSPLDMTTIASVEAAALASSVASKVGLKPDAFRDLIAAWTAYLTIVLKGMTGRAVLARIAEVLRSERMSSVTDETSLQRILILEFIQVGKLTSGELGIFSVVLDRYDIPRELLPRTLRGQRTADGVLFEDVWSAGPAVAAASAQVTVSGLQNALRDGLSPEVFRDMIQAWVAFLSFIRPGTPMLRIRARIAEVLMSDRVSAVRDEASLHRVLMLEFITVTRLRSGVIRKILGILTRYSIPGDLLLSTFEGQRSADGVLFAEIWNQVMADPATISGRGIVTFRSDAERSMLRPGILGDLLARRDEDSVRQVRSLAAWMASREWGDAAISKLIGIQTAEVLLALIRYVARNPLFSQIIERWQRFLVRAGQATGTADANASLLRSVMRLRLWEYGSEGSIHAALFRVFGHSVVRGEDDGEALRAHAAVAGLPESLFRKIGDVSLQASPDGMPDIIDESTSVVPDATKPGEASITGTHDRQYDAEGADPDMDIITFLEEGVVAGRTPDEELKQRIRLKGLDLVLGHPVLAPAVIDRIQDLFSLDMIRTHILDAFKVHIADPEVSGFIGILLGRFLKDAGRQRIGRLLAAFREIWYRPTVPVQMRVSGFLQEMFRFREMEFAARDVLRDRSLLPLRTSRYKPIRDLVLQVMRHEGRTLHDFQDVFSYFLDNGIIMPHGKVLTEKELYEQLREYLPKAPEGIRAMLHAGAARQASRKRILRFMATGFEKDFLMVIHPTMMQTLELFSRLAARHFRIDFWKLAGARGRQDRWDIILEHWAALSQKLRDPVELLATLVRRILDKLSVAELALLHSFPVSQMVVSERDLWKEILVLVPELRTPLPEKERKLKKKQQAVEEAGPVEPELLETGEGTTIMNAGLILLWPFLGRYFDFLNLTDGRNFIGEDEKIRAIQLSEYIVTGKTALDVFNLSLNKLLCGAAQDVAIPPVLDLKPEEEELTGKMLVGAISNWEKMNTTRPETFRESFLQREGRLYLLEDRWELTVERKAYDMLLNTLPWNIAMIQLNWMPLRLVINWR